MKIVTYNVHYAIGKDNRYDLQRLIDSVQGADIVALQEVERNFGPPDGPSQPEDISELLHDYYWVFDAAFDIDGSEKRPDGGILNRRIEHGQMLLSRWPILSKRYFPLPRLAIESEFNMQMGVLEAVIDTPAGALRFYNVHFGSVSSEERQQQANFVIKLVQNSPSEGGAWTGSVTAAAERDWSAGVAQPPMPKSAVVLGDFNMHPESPEYAIIATAIGEHNGPLLTDIWARKNPGSNVMTWHPNPGRPGDEQSARLDYCFVTADLIASAGASWVDESAQGSDHQPLWIDFETG
ncbi:MAG: endonuclease/exonuclease/phosphatase family protein [Gammaproteobacteria bacterium]|nr:endonuclease/exonuclease/phosphatase family protein [Gammaproteobacteria bacterium]